MLLQGKTILERAEQGKTSRFVLRSIWVCHYRRILPALALQLFYSGVQFAGPLLLNQIVKFISKPEALQTVRRQSALPATLPGSRSWATSQPFCTSPAAVPGAASAYAAPVG